MVNVLESLAKGRKPCLLPLAAPNLLHMLGLYAMLCYAMLCPDVSTPIAYAKVIINVKVCECQALLDKAWKFPKVLEMPQQKVLRMYKP